MSGIHIPDPLKRLLNENRTGKARLTVLILPAQKKTDREKIRSALNQALPPAVVQTISRLFLRLHKP